MLSNYSSIIGPLFFQCYTTSQACEIQVKKQLNKHLHLADLDERWLTPHVTWSLHVKTTWLTAVKSRSHIFTPRFLWFYNFVWFSCSWIWNFWSNVVYSRTCTTFSLYSCLVREGGGGIMTNSLSSKRHNAWLKDLIHLSIHYEYPGVQTFSYIFTKPHFQ